MTYERPSHPYRQFPTIPVTGHDGAVAPGKGAIQARLSSLIHPTEDNGRIVIIAEAYPGVDQEELYALFSPLEPAAAIHSDDLALAPEDIDAQIRRDLTDDPVFAVMTTRRLEEFFPPENLEAARRQIDAVDSGIVLVYGVGASLVCRGDILILADITRWEIQLRYRRGLSNWRTARTSLPRNEKYKRGYFAEWRWADRVKDGLLPRMDFYLDMTMEGAPAMVSGEAYRAALAQAAGQPFRMAPYFDPGVWGGDWMAARFGLPENGSNYAWSFDGVPEENSLLLDFGGQLIQTPALNLVHSHPKELLGDRVHARFGREFPIRFDMLDTMNGQNLSLQVHPLTEYIQQHRRRPGGDVPGPGGSPERRPGLPRGKVRQPHPREEARPCADPRRDGALLRRGYHGAGDQRHPLYLHLQALGLGAAGLRRQTPPHPPGARYGQHSMGEGYRVGKRKSDKRNYDNI